MPENAVKASFVVQDHETIVKLSNHAPFSITV